MSHRSLPVIVLLAVFLCGPVAHGAETGAEQDADENLRLVYSDLKGINEFRAVTVFLRGDAAKIGVNPDELREFARLRFRNSFAGYPLLGWSEAARKGPEDASRELGVITISVNMTGTDYPVAVHVEVRIERIGGKTPSGTPAQRISGEGVH